MRRNRQWPSWIAIPAPGVLGLYVLIMKTLELTAIIEGDKDGYHACCPELKGCQTQGGTVEEALANLREAAERYLETLSPEELESLAAAVPKTTLSTSLEFRRQTRLVTPAPACGSASLLPLAETAWRADWDSPEEDEACSGLSEHTTSNIERVAPR